MYDSQELKDLGFTIDEINNYFKLETKISFGTPGTYSANLIRYYVFEPVVLDGKEFNTPEDLIKYLRNA